MDMPMLDKLSRILRGYVVVEVNGLQGSRFINLAVKSGVRFWHYHREGEGYRFSMRSGEYRRLRTLRKKCGVSLHVVRKAGLPFRLLPLKKRPGLLLGFLGAVLLYSFLASHIWMMDVEGAGVYTKEQILAAAESVGVSVGVRRDSFDAQRASHQIMALLPDLEWASVNTEGSEAIVAVKQKIPKPDMVDENTVVNLVASKTGVVREIVAQEGRVRVQLNAAVSEGDLLVSGIWDSNDRKKEWERTDDVHIFTAASRGRVMAETTRQFTAYLPKKETVYDAGESHSRYTFGFFGVEVPFAPTLAGDGAYSMQSRQENLWLIGKELPLFLRTDVLTRQYAREREIGRPEAEARLLKLLTEEKRAGIAEGDSILSEEAVVFTEDENGYTAVVTCLCLENIAVPKAVILDSLP